MTFDRNAFIDWLDEKERPIYADELTSEWPDFPIRALEGCTGPILDNKFAYYRHDLRRIARGKRILD